jgi:hypothetical protein
VGLVVLGQKLVIGFHIVVNKKNHFTRCKIRSGVASARGSAVWLFDDVKEKGS